MSSGFDTMHCGTNWLLSEEEKVKYGRTHLHVLEALEMIERPPAKKIREEWKKRVDSITEDL